MGGIKYTQLNASSSFKGKSDRDKYQKARELDRYIGKIRKDYIASLKSNDDDARQLGK
jgi:DNA topoisomerase-1